MVMTFQCLHYSSAGNTLKTQFEHECHITLQDIKKYLKNFNKAELTNYFEIVTLLKLILVSPATNATSERTFSAMRRLKTYLRSTMGQARLNGLMITTKNHPLYMYSKVNV